MCKNLFTKAFDMDAVIDAFEAWSVHSYVGDYNPLHDHGVVTQQGLSCILYLKVPPQIEKINGRNNGTWQTTLVP